jgi:hypothetical protein
VRALRQDVASYLVRMTFIVIAVDFGAMKLLFLYNAPPRRRRATIALAYAALVGGLLITLSLHD